MRGLYSRFGLAGLWQGKKKKKKKEKEKISDL
jgi:hypothetical protein